MQFFRNAVLSAPTSFLVVASLRRVVRLACLAAASPEGGAEAGTGAVFAAGGATAPGTAAPGAVAAGMSARAAGGAAIKAPAMGSRQRHTAAASVEKRMVISPSQTQSHRQGGLRVRKKPTHNRPDEERVKLA